MSNAKSQWDALMALEKEAQATKEEAPAGGTAGAPEEMKGDTTIMSIAQKTSNPAEEEAAFSAATADEFDVVTHVVEDALNQLPAIGATFFKSKQHNVGTSKTFIWPALCRELSHPAEFASKEACPLFRLTTSKGASRAAGVPVEDVYGLVGDYDAEQVTVAEVVRRCRAAGVQALVYTSASHGVVGGKSHGGPRWRVVVTLSQPIPPANYAGMMDWLNGALGGILARESWEATRCYFYGRVRGVEFEAHEIAGDPLDLVILAPDFEPIGQPATPERTASTLATVRPPAARDELDRQIALGQVTEETLADLRDALSAISADERDVWVEMGLAMASLKGTPYGDEARDVWVSWSRSSAAFVDGDESLWDTFDTKEATHLKVFAVAQEPGRGWVNPRSAAALKANATAATRQDRTDAGNVTLLAALTAGNLRYVPERRVWLWWDGDRWNPDEYGTHAQLAALEVAEHYHRKALELRKHGEGDSTDAKEAKKIGQAADLLEKWATHCRNKRSVDAMLNMAKADERFALGVAALDRDPHLFGVANGVVDLRTGELRAAGRDDFVTRRSPAAFNPAARAPRWEQFIEEVTAKPQDGAAGFHPRPGLAAYMQRALGYTMTAATGEHKMFVCIGQGSNGKNVLLDILQWLMGDYCQTIPPEALMATRHDADAERPSPTAATLAGARAAISSESKDGARLDVALVKRHTGGGYMTARYMRENTFRFEITHKLWLMTNHRPALDHMDEAMRGRLHLVPFDMRWNRPGHPDRNPALPDGDKDLPGKLKDEAEGVLAWLVRGAVAYAAEGLEPPAEVARMTREFFQDQDPLGRWLSTCTACEPKRGSLASELFTAFLGWQDLEAEEGGPATQTAFSLALKARGIARSEGREGNRYALRAAG